MLVGEAKNCSLTATYVEDLTRLKADRSWQPFIKNLLELNVKQLRWPSRVYIVSTADLAQLGERQTEANPEFSTSSGL